MFIHSVKISDFHWKKKKLLMKSIYEELLMNAYGSI